MIGRPRDRWSKQNGRAWDRWAASLTVAAVERIAQAPNPALALWRLKWHHYKGPQLPPDVMRAVRVAYHALPSGPPDDEEVDGPSSPGALNASPSAYQADANKSRRRLTVPRNYP